MAKGKTGTSVRLAKNAKSGKRAMPPRFKKKDWSNLGTGFTMPDRDWRAAQTVNSKEEIKKGLAVIDTMPVGSDPFLRGRLRTHLENGYVSSRDLG